MSAKILMILAPGFEEIEAVTPADVLKRVGFDVVLAGMETQMVVGAHNIPIEADCLLGEVDLNDFDVVMLPGGMPGSVNLRDNEDVIDLLKQAAGAGLYTCAICAAPIALAKAGLLAGKKFTCYPGFDQECDGIYTAALAEEDGKVITGKGPGAAYAYAAKIATALGKGAEVTKTFQGMFVQND